MANPQNASGRSVVRRGLSELVDRAFLGNRGHDFNTGYWDKTGAIQGGIQGVAGAVNPGLGLLTRLFINRYNRNNQAGDPMQLDPMTLSPAGQMPYSYGGPQAQNGFGGIAQGQQTPFDPNNPFAMPQQPQQGGRPRNYGAFTPQQYPNTGAFQSLLSNQGGGARGMHSQGGITGDAARFMFAGMSAADRFRPIDTGREPYQS